MQFEFDPAKSEMNRAKHGIDFVEAQALWYDRSKKTLPLSFEGEPRFICIGKIGPALWAGIFTWRGQRIRIISVRRVRKSERLIYEQDLG
ncbi:BrnT family toxin [Rhizobium sp. RU35A]|nr:BrnT family toxin [Rhizobium sp. RU35A]